MRKAKNIPTTATVRKMLQHKSGGKKEAHGLFWIFGNINPVYCCELLNVVWMNRCSTVWFFFFYISAFIHIDILSCIFFLRDKANFNFSASKIIWSFHINIFCPTPLGWVFQYSCWKKECLHHNFFVHWISRAILNSGWLIHNTPCKWKRHSILRTNTVKKIMNRKHGQYQNVMLWLAYLNRCI